MLSAGALAARRRPVKSPPAEKFRLALPGYRLRFPRDHFAHSDFANEWWYFTGNLRASNGKAVGFELTFFRIAPFPGASLMQDYYLAHFAVSDLGEKTFHFHERARRGLWQQAGLERNSDGSFLLYNGNWELRMGRQGPESLQAAWGGMGLRLKLGLSPIMLNGQNGLSQKGPRPGQASYYYSLPRIPAQGWVRVDGQTLQVHGLVWMDHEFASNQLAGNQQGWDWMGLQLQQQAAPGQKGRDLDLMLFQLRDTNGQRDPHSAATVRMATPAAERQGLGAGAPGVEVLHLGESGFQMTPARWWRSPQTGIRYPVAWTVEVPSERLQLTVEARQENQELRPKVSGVDYWEGAVNVRGSWQGHAVDGHGYLELTGYGKALRALGGGR